jgi:superfamily I DNA/RNA helicase
VRRFNQRYSGKTLKTGLPREFGGSCGDDDQSIYAFQGARVGNMADFVQEFRVHQIKWNRNYHLWLVFSTRLAELISLTTDWVKTSALKPGLNRYGFEDQQ